MYQDMMDNIGCVAAQDEDLAAAMNRELARLAKVRDTFLAMDEETY